MVAYRRVDVEKAEGMPMRDLIHANVVQTEETLARSAMIGFSAALGNHPDLLSSDQEYSQFVASYVTDVLIPYAERAAAAQLGLLSVGGRIETVKVWKAFVPELSKVQSVVLPNEEAAALILGDRDRGWNFLLALIAAIGIVCRRRPAMGELFGLKKSLFGGWKPASSF